MSRLTQALRDCARCGDVRHSNVPEGIEYIRRMSEHKPHRPQWAFKPSDGDIVGRKATRAERQAIRRLYRQGRLP